MLGQTPRAEYLAAEEWAQPFVERWELVALTMNGFEPTTWTGEDKRDVYAAVSDRSLADVFEDETP